MTSGWKEVTRQVREFVTKLCRSDRTPSPSLRPWTCLAPTFRLKNQPITVHWEVKGESRSSLPTDHGFRLVRVLRVEFIQFVFQAQNFFRVNCDVSGLALKKWSTSTKNCSCAGSIISIQTSTCAPPNGWWTIIRALGRECRMPWAPEASRKEPILHACPTHHVATGGRMYCIVSYIPNPAVTEPPKKSKTK